MSVSFCVLDEEWIPVITLDGTPQEVSLRTLLQNAHKLRKISDASPLVEYSLYRFVIVFLMDALRPQNQEELEELLQESEFPMEKIEAYIKICETEGMKFDLFDAQRPFLQAPFRAEWDKARKSVSTLDYTIPNGHNHTHFDHRNNKEIRFSYAQAARLLPVVQLFCGSGGRGYSPGINGTPYYSIIRGKTLFETLLYSMTYVERVQRNFDEQPVLWRNTIEVEPQKKIGAVSWLFGMLFPARRILLIPEESSEMIAEMYWNSGLVFKGADSWTDPHVSYCYGKRNRVPLLPERDKAIWRNLNDLIEDKYAPEVLTQYKKIKDEELYAHIIMYGVETEKGKATCFAMMRHDMEIPVALIDNEEYTKILKDEIDAAEKLASALQASLTHEDISPMVSQQAVQLFYDDCEKSVKILCNHLATEDDRTATMQNWRKSICESARKRWDIAWDTISLRGKAIAKVIEQKAFLLKTIKEVRSVE